MQIKLAAKLEALNRSTSRGVHAEVSELEVNQAIIQLTIGDIVRLAELQERDAGRNHVEKEQPNLHG